jgi:signal transduction histidine kinase
MILIVPTHSLQRGQTGHRFAAGNQVARLGGCRSHDREGDTMTQVMHEQLSHGLRTPLTSVLGYASTLLEHWDTLGEAERLMFIRIVYGEALRMAHSVEQVDRQLYDEFAPGERRSDLFKRHGRLADAS